MPDKFIESFNDLHKPVESYGDKVIIYRGVTNLAHKLIPEVGRRQRKASDIKKRKEQFCVFLNKGRRPGIGGEVTPATLTPGSRRRTVFTALSNAPFFVFSFVFV
jgi:hypothetical protein